MFVWTPLSTLWLLLKICEKPCLAHAHQHITSVRHVLNIKEYVCMVQNILCCVLSLLIWKTKPKKKHLMKHDELTASTPRYASFMVYECLKSQWTTLNFAQNCKTKSQKINAEKIKNKTIKTKIKEDTQKINVARHA